MAVRPSISHDRQEETPEAKARWFQSLSMEERMDILCELTDLALAVNPSLLHRPAETVPGRVQVISSPVL